MVKAPAFFSARRRRADERAALVSLLLFPLLLGGPSAVRAGEVSSPGIVFAKARILPFVDGDGDGLPDGSERLLKTDAANPDSDGDGLSDGLEALELNTEPSLYDSDGDGFGDGREVAAEANPMDTRSFPVRLSGSAVYGGAQTGAVWVVAVTNTAVWASSLRSLGPRPPGAFLFTNLVSRRVWSVQAWLDVQADGVRAAWEPSATTGLFSPTGDIANVLLELADSDADTDGNGLIDRLEWRWFGRLGVDPLGDDDRDDLLNVSEFAYGTNPLNRDTDGDGLRDGNEVAYDLDPLAPCTPISVGIALVAGHGVLLDWNTQFSQGYLPQYRDSLTDGAWSNLTPHAVYEYDQWPEGRQALIDRGGAIATQRFYRVLAPVE